MRYVAALIVTLIISLPASAVRVPREVTVMVIHPSGDVILSMPKARGPDDVRWSVARLDPRSGRLRWQYWLSRGTRGAQDFVDDLALSADGDVVAVGSTAGELLVVRLASSDGSVRWRRLFHGTRPAGYAERAFDIALGPDGALAIGGMLAHPDLDGIGTPAVLRLDAVSGDERWRFTPPPERDGRVSAVAFATNGDVFAAGGAGTASLWRLAGDGGTPRWRRDVAPGWVNGMALDLAGNPVLAVTLDGDAAHRAVVTKTDAATGAPVWTTSGSETGVVDSPRLAVDAMGAVFVAGAGVGPDPLSPPDGTFVLSRLDGASGTLSWTRRLAGPFGAAASTLALSPVGPVIVGGFTSTADTCQDGVVIAVDPGTGDAVGTWTYDGTAASRDCRPVCVGRCPVVDDDGVDVVASDGAGYVFTAGRRIDRVGGHRRFRAFLQREGPLVD